MFSVWCVVSCVIQKVNTTSTMQILLACNREHVTNVDKLNGVLWVHSHGSKDPNWRRQNCSSFFIFLNDISKIPKKHLVIVECFCWVSWSVILSVSCTEVLPGAISKVSVEYLLPIGLITVGILGLGLAAVSCCCFRVDTWTFIQGFNYTNK